MPALALLAADWAVAFVDGVVRSSHAQIMTAARQWFRACWELGEDPVLTPYRPGPDRVHTICLVLSVCATIGYKGRGCIASTITGFF